jgi:ribonuclease Z
MAMRRAVQVLTVSFLILTLASCERLMLRELEKRLDRQKVDMLKDGKMHVVLVGTGGPMNNTRRVTTCTAVIAGGEFILVDVGPGTLRNADLQDLPLSALTCVFITHFHADHIGDLGEANFQSWAAGRRNKLEVYGPSGVEGVVRGFTQAYEADTRYRIAHHGKDVMPPEASRPVVKTISIQDPGAAELVLERNGLKAYAFLVDHFPAEPAVGYRFEYKGNVVVITGDTKKTHTLTKHAKSADILVSEALSFKMVATIQKVMSDTSRARFAKMMQDIPEYHMSPVQAAEVARDAGAGKLVLNHVVPPVTNFLAGRMFMEGVRDVYGGEIVLGEDGMSFALDPKI